MNCSESREKMSALLDGVLGTEESAALREHLDECVGCREFHRGLEGTIALVKDLPEPAVPPGFTEEIVARLPRSTRRLRLVHFLPLAAAAVLLVLALLGLNEGRHASPDRTDVADSPAVESHRSDHEEEPEGLVAASEKGRREAGESRGRPEAARDAAGEGGGKAPCDAGEPGRSSTPAEEEAEPSSTPGIGGGSGGSASAATRLAPAGAPPPPARPAADCPPEDRPMGPASGPAGFAGSRSGACAPDRRYRLAGVEPDTAAGLLLAELNAQRARKETGKQREGDRAGRESVRQGTSGEPERLILSLTACELEYVKKLVERMRGAILERVNGHGVSEASGSGSSGPDSGAKKAEEAARGDDEASRRFKVEVRLCR